MSNISFQQYSNSQLAEMMINALELNPDFEKQAEEKFEYFRMGLPEVRYEIDVKDSPVDLISNLESYIKNPKTRKEIYDLCNAFRCSENPIEKIDINVVKFGTISLSVCSQCIKKFR